MSDQKRKAITTQVGRLARECAQLHMGLKRAEQIAQETISILADDHNSEAGCLFAGASGEDLGCFACLAQDKLGDITVEALTSEAKEKKEKI